MLALRNAAVRSAKGAGKARAFSSSSRRTQDISLTIDGKQVSIPQGSSLIQACEKAGATIPRFC